MKILFDAYWWHDGPPSGRMVVREIIREWSIQFPEDELFALVRQGETTERLPANVTQVCTRLRPHALATARLPMVAKHLRTDATIAQNFALAGKGSSLFVHDVLFQSNPEYFTRLERLYLALIPFSIKNSKHVFTSSRTESERIRKHNPRAPGIYPVGLGIGGGLLKAIPRRPEMPQVDNGFVLTVGRLNIRKNLDRVFKAARHSARLSPHFPLLVVGEADGKLSELDPTVQALVEQGTIRFLGGVSDAELRWLYENSSLLVFGSLDEGFGLPPSEALYFGCPVAISDITVFHEIYGSAASYFNPRDVTSISAAIDNALDVLPNNSNDVGERNISWESVVAKMRAVVDREPSNA